MSSSKSARSIKLPRHRQRAIASTLLDWFPPTTKKEPIDHPIKIVCISDTHTTQPVLHDGDVLLHADDLSEVGSFSEIQAQLTWLSSQPHKHKVMIAGNHDVLFDRSFLEKNPQYNPEPTKTAADLDFGSVVYLCNGTATLDFPKHGGRQLRIYGSPYTPAYGISALQYPCHTDVWTNTVPDDTDIVLTHGPPYGHLDGALHAGCPDLAQELARVKPRLMVFGHIHVGHGRESVQFHAVRNAYEGVQGGWEGWPAIIDMFLRVMLANCFALLSGGRWRSRHKTTTLVDAALLDGKNHEFLHDAITVEL